jgi:ELWxxDGT repeat protein
MDINTGAGNSSPSWLAALNRTLFFSATDGIDGLELWQSDGTTAGTVQVMDIQPGIGSSSPWGLTAASSRLFFAADDGTRGVELWALFVPQNLYLPLIVKSSG